MKWVLLLMYADIAIIYHPDEAYFTSKKECMEGFQGVARAVALKNQQDEEAGKPCYGLCGPLFGFCVEGELVLPAPGIITTRKPKGK